MTPGTDPAASSGPNDVDGYGFLASAIAGRTVSVEASSKNEAVAYSDGRSIYLPARRLEAGANPWLDIAAQAALIGAGSLHPEALRQLIGRPAAAQRYLYLEMLRATRLLADRLPWALTERAELRASALTDSAQASLSLAATKIPLPEPPAYFGRIWPLLGLRVAIGERGLSAVTRKQQPARLAETQVPEVENGGESSALLRLFQNPWSSGNPLADWLNGIVGAGASRNEATAGEGGAEMPVGRVEKSLRRGIHAVLSALALESPALDRTAMSRTQVYPEWDVHAKSYRRNWVSVQETEPWREDAGAAPALHAPRSVELRRQLEGLGLDQELHRRQTEGSDLDLGALIECAIEWRAGHSAPSPRVYRASLRTRRDLGVAIVLDISGSTGEQPAAGESIFDKQVRLAYRLGHVLDSLGDAVALFGFHSWGRQRVHVVRIKGQGERWSMRVAERLAMLEPVGYTRIGTAIRHGTQVLRERMRLPNRLLVLITDGIAYDQDYELDYAAADARKALEEAHDCGTACVCLSVGAATAAAQLADVFGGANILAVDEVDQVTGRIRELCRHALAAVSRRRFRR